MSEYSKFLNYFNTKKGSEKKDGAPEEPVSEESFTSPTEEENVQSADSFADDIRTVIAADEDFSRQKKGKRFIKTEEEQSVHSGTKDNDATEVEVFTDRLESHAADETQDHTGYTGKINTYAVNRTDGGSKFKPESEEDEEREEEDVKLADGKTFSDAFSQTEGSRMEEESDDGSAEGRGEEAPTKHISSEKASLLMEIAKSSAEEAGEDPEQLVLEGFSDSGHENEKKETELRSQLKKNRQKRIDGFNFWNSARPETGKNSDRVLSPENEKPSLPERIEKFTEKFADMEYGLLKFKTDEYKYADEHRTVFKGLVESRKDSLIRAGALGVLGFVMLIINICASVTAATHNGFFTIMNGSTRAYALTNLAFLAVATVLTFDDLKNGVITLLRGHPKTDSALVFMMVSSLTETLALFLTSKKAESDFHMFTGVILLMCAVLMISKMFYYDSTRHCFKSVSAKHDISCLRNISDKNLAAAVLSESSSRDHKVTYIGKTRFIKNFLARSRNCAFGGQTSSRMTLIAFAVSVLSGIIAAAVNRSFIFGLSVICFSSVLTFPVGCLLFTGFLISGENKSLSTKAAYIRSYSDARDLASVNNIVIRAQDIFSVKITETVCAGGVSEKQAKFCASALTDGTGGLLEKAFKTNARDKEKVKVENLTYEDKLGFSAWVNDCRVLLGSNTFLVNHNVKMPDESGVLNFIDSDNLPIYLAIEGHFTAMFSAKYTCRSDTVKNIKALADNGTNILISSNDPNITDSFAEQLLDLPADSVRILNNSTSERLSVQQQTVTDAEDAGIIFGDFDSFCRCSVSALKLDKLKKLAKLICETGIGSGLALTAILAMTSSTGAISWWLPLLLQILWIFLCFFIPPLLTASSVSSGTAVRPIARKAPLVPENYKPRPKKNADSEIADEPDPDDLQTRTDAKKKPPVQNKDRRSILEKIRSYSDYDEDGEEYDDGDPETEAVSHGKPAAVSEQQPAAASEQQPAAVSEQQPTSASEEQPTSVSEEQPTSVSEEENGREYTIEELLQTSFFKQDKKSQRDDKELDGEELFDDDPRQKSKKRSAAQELQELTALAKDLAKKALSDKKKPTAKKRPDINGRYGEDEGRSTFRTSSKPAAAKKRPTKQTSAPKAEKPSILPFAEETPKSPGFDRVNSDEYDFLNAKFVPPESTSEIFTDDFFKRFEADGEKLLTKQTH